MTAATPHPPANPNAPEVTLPATVQAAAGAPALVPVRILHRGQVPATMRITVLGLDSRWAPAPLDLGPMQPGEAASVTLTLVPERGALGARYPFVIAVEATAVRGTSAPVIGVAEAVLSVDSQERISMSIQPPTPTAVFGRTFRVQITNPGSTDRSFALMPDAAAGARVRLRTGRVDVPAQRTVSVKGKVHIRRPSILGGENTHVFSVTAQGTGAPEFAEATVRSRPLIQHGARVAVGLVVVVAMWAALAVVFIPKISDAFKPTTQVRAPSTVTSQGPVASTGGAAGSSGSGASGPGGNSGAGQGGSGSAGSSAGGGEGGSSGGATSGGYQLAGTVTGPGAKGVTVTLAPTSLLGASDVNAKPAPGSSASTANALRSVTSGAMTKVFGPTLPTGNLTQGSTSTTTPASGQFRFAGISSPGYYLLTLAKAGFQTQRFLINSTDLASPKPMKVALVPGDGMLSGTVTDPDGQAIGAAKITITDGTVSLQTSSVSKSASGTPGTWSADHLSTPGSYLVTATAAGYGGASKLIKLEPKEKATVSLELTPGQASIVGTVRGEDADGNTTGLGGVTVTATGGKTVRTATTVTSQALRGNYILPSMPAPGTYTLTISADGYLTQTSSVEVGRGVGSMTVDATLTRANATVHGTVTGLDATGKSEGGLAGVGLTLTSSTTTLKTMTTSGQSAGSFRFTGVPPGTYVLTASQYGRTPASATVEVASAGSKTVNLVLKASNSTALPATSRIRGVVVDARSQGPLTCDRQQIPDAQKCVITVSLKEPVLTPQGQSGSKTQTITATALPKDPNYQIPSVDGDTAGIRPGSYLLTISAPGYETATTRVEVGQGQTVQAPQVALQPLAIVSGTVTTKVGSPATPTCVIVTPGATKPSDLPTGCSVPDKADSCSVGTAGARCALVGADGSYQIRGMTHGNYQILVLPTDPEYLPVRASALQIPVGTDGRYDASLDRYGRAQVTVQVPNPNTGTLSPAAGVTVTARTVDGAATPLAPSGTTSGAGTVLFKGLNGTYTVAAQGSSARPTSLDVPLDQTVTTTLVVTHPLDPVVGRITTQVDPAINGGSGIAGVDDAAVTVTGIVGYSDGSPVYGTAQVTTDSHGCFAIVPKGWSGPAPSSIGTSAPDCPPVAGSATVSMQDPSDATASLVALPITISVDESRKGKAYQANAVIVPGTGGRPDTIPVQVVPTQPTPLGTLTLRAVLANGTTPATGTPVNNAVITVTKQPAGSGTVSVTADPDGTLNWSDPPLGPNLAVPGLYTLRATLPGYTDAVVDVRCGLGATNCRLVANKDFPPPPGASGAFVLRQYPTFRGKLILLPTTSNLSSLTLSVTPTPAGTGAVHVTADLSNDLHWSEEGLPAGLVRPGVPYTITASLDGYASAQASVNCTVSSCRVVSLTLYQPTTLTLEFVDSDGHAPVSHVLASIVGNGGSASSTVNSGTTNSVSFFGLAVENAYHFNFDAPGYRFLTGIRNAPFTGSSAMTSISCTNPPISNSLTDTPPGLGMSVTGFVLLPGGTTTCRVELTRLGSVVTTVAGHNGSWTSNLSNARVTVKQLTDASGKPVLGAPTFSGTTGSNGVVRITGTNENQGLNPGTYTVTASYPGYTTDSQNVQVAGSSATSMVLTLQVIPVTLQVHLQNAKTTTDVLPYALVYLLPTSDTSLPLVWCEVQNGAVVPGSGSSCTVTNGDPLKYMTFTGVNPGSYTAYAFSGDRHFQDTAIPIQVVLNTTGADQKVSIPLTVATSTVTVSVVKPNGTGGTTPVEDAKVAIWPVGGSGPALDISDDELVCPTDTSSSCENNGVYTFEDVLDGDYQAVVDAPGYARVVSATFSTDSVRGSRWGPPTVVLSARASRYVVLPVGTTAASGDLTGATATLVPVTKAGALDSSRAALTNLAVTSSDGQFEIDAPDVPLGDWYAALTTATNRHLLTNSAGSSTDYFDRTPTFTVVDQPDRNNPTPQVFKTASLFQEASATLTATWDTGGACNSNNLPGSGTMQFTITRTDAQGDDVFSEDVDAAISGGSASIDVVLPAGTYTWQPTNLQNSWTGSKQDITVNADGSTASGKGTITPTGSLKTTLTPSLIAVTASMTIDSEGASGFGITSVPAGRAGSDTQFDDDGSATLCLPAGSTTFSVASTTTVPQIALPDQSVAVSTSNKKVTFTGYTLNTGVSDKVKGRSADNFDRAVDLSLTRSSQTPSEVWSGSATIPSGSTTADGPSVVVPAGSDYTLTATPSAGSDTVFSAGSTGTFTVDEDHSPVSKTVTLTYGQATATVTVKKQGTQLGKNDPAASITLSANGSTIGPVQTGNTAGTYGIANLVGLSPNTTYTVTVVGTGADADLTGSGSLTTGDSGDATTTINYGATATVTVSKNGNLLTPTDPPATVTLSDDGVPVATLTTDSTGRAVFSGLTANTTYDVSMVGTGTDANLAGTGTITTNGAGTDNASKTIAYGATATITVTKQGAPLISTDPPATITLTPPAGGTELTAETIGTDGSTTIAYAVFTGLAANTTYDVTVTGTGADADLLGTGTVTTGNGGTATATKTVAYGATALVSVTKDGTATTDDVTVTAKTAGADAVDCDTTNSDGDYICAGLDGNTSYTFKAVDGNYSATQTATTAGQGTDSTVVPTIDMQSPKLKVTVTADGSAVSSGISVAFTLSSTPDSHSDSCTTGSGGSCTLEDLKANTTYTVTAEFTVNKIDYKGSGQGTTATATSPTPGVPIDATSPSLTVQVNRGGSGQNGATVNIFVKGTTKSIASGKTSGTGDSTGTFTFTGLDASKTYTATADWDSSATPPVHYSGSNDTGKKPGAAGAAASILSVSITEDSG